MQLIVVTHVLNAQERDWLLDPVLFLLRYIGYIKEITLFSKSLLHIHNNYVQLLLQSEEKRGVFGLSCLDIRGKQNSGTRDQAECLASLAGA